MKELTYGLLNVIFISLIRYDFTLRTYCEVYLYLSSCILSGYYI